MKKIFTLFFVLAITTLFNISFANNSKDIEVSPYFTLNYAHFEGNTVHSEQELENLIKEKIGTKISDWDLIVLISKIKYLYESEGYQHTDAYIKNVDYKNGNFVICVEEVKYGNVEIDATLQENEVKKLLSKHNIKSGNLLNINDLKKFQADISANNLKAETYEAVVSMPDNTTSRIIKITIKENI